LHSIIIHQHLYQPPREDPWLEVVRAEPSAAPDHDWNARINRECYARQAVAEAHLRDQRAAARDPDARAGIARIVNLYAWCSFDVGPTLCEWLEAEAPDTLRAMQEGDAASVRRWGHGNAIAAPYHHVILPLASPRERRTEIRWGIKDFRRRFGRDPEGLWLPECAADEDTLDAVAAEGIAFTILAPYQVYGHDGSGMPVRWRGASGRTLTIVPYDGSLAADVAFGGLLKDAPALAHRLTPYRESTWDGPRCTTLATDGETFGHHHRGGESTLTEALAIVTHQPGTRLTNAAALVASHPPTVEVTLASPSAWSCAHGVERWRSNCGCRLDANKPPLQQWRGALRTALEQLAAHSHEVFEREGRALFREDPWHVRDNYGDVVGQDGEALEAFARAAVHETAGEREVVRARELLELERATLRTFTSCAWFFDEVDRIEVRQVLRYAARSIELSGNAARLTPELVHWLAPATNGLPEAGSASELFVREALPHRDNTLCVAAAAMAHAAVGQEVTRIATFDIATVPRDEGWAVHTTHRRTGAVAVFHGRVTGSGTSLRVRIGDADRDEASWEQVSAHEFPESSARSILASWALDDHAITGQPAPTP
jgi:alpha-amylase/alpha-mannosidase (GH57 family)